MESYCARALFRTLYEYDWDGAEADFVRAINLNPSSAIARFRWAYFHLRTLGRFEEAKAQNDRAFELDPLSLMIRFGTAHLSFMLGDRDKAVKQARAALELYPGSWLGCRVCGQIFASAGLFQEAEEVKRLSA